MLLSSVAVNSQKEASKHVKRLSTIPHAGNMSPYCHHGGACTQFSVTRSVNPAYTFVPYSSNTCALQTNMPIKLGTWKTFILYPSILAYHRYVFYIHLPKVALLQVSGSWWTWLCRPHQSVPLPSSARSETKWQWMYQYGQDHHWRVETNIYVQC